MAAHHEPMAFPGANDPHSAEDRKSTRLNSSHDQISYAVFCLKKKKTAPDKLEALPLATDDDAHANDSEIPSRRGPTARGLRQFDPSGHPVNYSRVPCQAPSAS